MAQLDKYLQHLLRAEARSLLLQSNGPVVARLPSGIEKASSQVVDHAMLVAVVQEASPAEALAEIRASRPTRFVYPADDPKVVIEVTPTPGAWRVQMTPLPVSSPIPAVRVPGASTPQPGRGSVPPGSRASVYPRRGPTEVIETPFARTSATHPAVSQPPAGSASFAARPSRPSLPAAPASADPPGTAPVRRVQSPARGVGAVPFASMPAGPPVSAVPPAPVAPVVAVAPAAPVASASAAPAPVAPPVAVEPALPPAPAPAPGGPVLSALADAAVPVGDLDTAAIDRLLRAMAKVGASDLHLGVGRPPLVRLHGSIRALEADGVPFTEATLLPLLYATMPQSNRAEYGRIHDTDYAYEIAGVARFRCNVYFDRKGPAAAMRRIPEEILSPEQLGLSRPVLELCNLSKGLVLITGPTGSGKSTTLAALIDRINTTRRDHIITIEDPIEFVHRNKRCLINQREVRVHTESFRDALRAALREDPDVVLVGELRDLETMAMAIETAETGHLVFGTLHTRTAASTIDRIIDPFPAERQGQIRTMLSESLKGVVAQTLCKKIGGGRVAAYETLLVTPAVANLIREGKTFQIPSIMQTNRALGMTTLQDSLCELVKSGRIEAREALSKALSRAEMHKMLTEMGVRVPEPVGVRD